MADGFMNMAIAHFDELEKKRVEEENDKAAKEAASRGIGNNPATRDNRNLPPEAEQQIKQQAQKTVENPLEQVKGQGGEISTYKPVPLADKIIYNPDNTQGNDKTKYYVTEQYQKWKKLYEEGKCSAEEFNKAIKELREEYGAVADLAIKSEVINNWSGKVKPLLDELDIDDIADIKWNDKRGLNTTPTTTPTTPTTTTPLTESQEEEEEEEEESVEPNIEPELSNGLQNFIKWDTLNQLAKNMGRSSTYGIGGKKIGEGVEQGTEVSEGQKEYLNQLRLAQDRRNRQLDNDVDEAIKLGNFDKETAAKLKADYKKMMQDNDLKLLFNKLDQKQKIKMFKELADEKIGTDDLLKASRIARAVGLGNSGSDLINTLKNEGMGYLGEFLSQLDIF